MIRGESNILLKNDNPVTRQSQNNSSLFECKQKDQQNDGYLDRHAQNNSTFLL